MGLCRILQVLLTLKLLITQTWNSQNSKRGTSFYTFTYENVFQQKAFPSQSRLEVNYTLREIYKKKNQSN